jgi:hypothetical protein
MVQPEESADPEWAHPKIAAFAGYWSLGTLIGGTSVFLCRLMLIAAVAGAIAAQSRAAESQSAPGVSDTQIKIGQTIPYSGRASSFATIGRTQAAYYRMINAAGGLDHSVGVVTAEFLKEPGDLVWQDDPEVRAYLDLMKNYNSGVDPDDWSNVIAYYMASAVVEALKSCGAELTRERLLDRVSHMEEVAVPMLIPGITLNTTPTDYHAIKQMRLKRFDGALGPARRHYQRIDNSEKTARKS